jgi:hypothetical protein
VLPKNVFFSNRFQKYKSCGPRAKIIVVGAIFNFSAILQFKKKIVLGYFLNSLIFQNPKLQIICIIFDKSGAFYVLSAILDFSAIFIFKEHKKERKKIS